MEQKVDIAQGVDDEVTLKEAVLMLTAACEITALWPAGDEKQKQTL